MFFISHETVYRLWSFVCVHKRQSLLCFLFESYCVVVRWVVLRDQLTYCDHQCMNVECTSTSLVSIESAMLVTCCMQCVMYVSLVLLLTACVSRSLYVQVSPHGPWAVTTLRECLFVSVSLMHSYTL